MRKPFRRSDAPRLSAEQAERQGRISRLAFETLGGRDAAVAFLNEPHATLGARPLDLAVESADGLEAAEAALRAAAV